MPNAVYQPELCIRTTLQAAEQYGFDINQIMFEVTESEQVNDINHLKKIFEHYRERGFLTAIDDFGAGFSGLNLLADLEVEILKLDMHLTRDIDSNRRKHAIVRGITKTCHELGIRIIAEGIESEAEYHALSDIGITLYQGFLFARPQYQGLAAVYWPD